MFWFQKLHMYNIMQLGLCSVRTPCAGVSFDKWYKTAVHVLHVVWSPTQSMRRKLGHSAERDGKPRFAVRQHHGAHSHQQLSLVL